MQLILVVEDEYGAAQVLAMVLEAHGYRVASAANGKAALELLAGERPAVIVSDFMMPHMNGAELGAAIRSNALLSDIPFIVLSGTDEVVVQAAFADYDFFLSKTSDIDELLSAIAALLTGRQKRTAPREVHESVRHLLKGLKLPPDT